MGVGGLETQVSWPDESFFTCTFHSLSGGLLRHKLPGFIAEEAKGPTSQVGCLSSFQNLTFSLHRARSA